MHTLLYTSLTAYGKDCKRWTTSERSSYRSSLALQQKNWKRILKLVALLKKSSHHSELWQRLVVKIKKLKGMYANLKRQRQIVFWTAIYKLCGKWKHAPKCIQGHKHSSELYLIFCFGWNYQLSMYYRHIWRQRFKRSLIVTLVNTGIALVLAQLGNWARKKVWRMVLVWVSSISSCLHLMRWHFGRWIYECLRAENCDRFYTSPVKMLFNLNVGMAVSWSLKKKWRGEIFWL